MENPSVAEIKTLGAKLALRDHMSGAVWIIRNKAEQATHENCKDFDKNIAAIKEQLAYLEELYAEWKKL